MRLRMKSWAPLIGAVGMAAAAGALSTSLSSAQVWPTNNVKQKMLAGEKIVARRIDAADPAKYCAMASAPGTDFVWLAETLSKYPQTFSRITSAIACSVVWAIERCAEVAPVSS